MNFAKLIFFIGIGFLVVMGIVLVVRVGFTPQTNKIITQTTATSQSGEASNIEISEFTPALYVTEDYYYLPVENNLFHVDTIWFYVNLNDIKMQKMSDGRYYEHYVMFLSVVDNDSNIIQGYNNSLIYNNDNYYSTNITSEDVKFSLNVADYADGVYYTRLSVVDILSNSSTFRDSYFEVRR